jgi:hypothetical protein
LHWADKQKPLQEVAGQFGVFPETVKSPPLVPEAVDEETPLPALEVALDDDEVMLVEHVTATEHPIAVEHVPASSTEPDAGRHASEPVT